MHMHMRVSHHMLHTLRSSCSIAVVGSAVACGGGSPSGDTGRIGGGGDSPSGDQGGTVRAGDVDGTGSERAAVAACGGGGGCPACHHSGECCLRRSLCISCICWRIAACTAHQQPRHTNTHASTCAHTQARRVYACEECTCVCMCMHVHVYAWLACSRTSSISSSFPPPPPPLPPPRGGCAGACACAAGGARCGGQPRGSTRRGEPAPSPA